MPKKQETKKKPTPKERSAAGLKRRQAAAISADVIDSGKTALTTHAESISTLDTFAGARVTFTAGGMVIGQTLTADHWTELLGRMKQVHDAYHNNLADLITYGRKEFGAEFVDQKLEQLAFDMPDVTRADAIGQLSLELRTEFNLTSEHHYVLGRAFPGEPKKQAEWAAKAQKHELSALALKRSLEAPEGPTLITDEQLTTLTGRHSGQPVLQGVSLEVKRWVNALGGEDKLIHSSEAVRKAFVEEIRPIVEIYEHVVETIKE